MKIFKLKYIVMLISASLLWSCQTEQAFSDAAVATTKKALLPDGIPSDANDPYDFAKSTYYHNNTVITDTLLIKQMLATARGLHIDETGFKKLILVTEQEAKAFRPPTENTDNSRTATSGDNYLHYFFERTAYVYNPAKASEKIVMTYWTAVGPRSYTDTPRYEYNFHQYYKANWSEPVTGSDQYYTTLWKTQWFLYPSNANSFFEINVYNPTGFKRRVYFYAEDGRTVTRDILPKFETTFYGAQISVNNNWKIFEGLLDFKLSAHASYML